MHQPQALKLCPQAELGVYPRERNISRILVPDLARRARSHARAGHALAGLTLPLWWAYFTVHGGPGVGGREPRPPSDLRPGANNREIHEAHHVLSLQLNPSSNPLNRQPCTPFRLPSTIPGVTSSSPPSLHHLRAFSLPALIRDPLHHLTACAHSRCLRSYTTSATKSSGHFFAWSHSLDSTVIYLTRVAGETCHAGPTLPSLRSLPERQPAGPFGTWGFVNPSKV